MKKPIIGISGSIIIDEAGMFPGYRRSYVNEDYVKAVLKNGGIPVIIPMTEDEETIEAQIHQIDGLILSGGHDISTDRYNEEPRQKLGDTSSERDAFDFLLLEKAEEKNIPILGICRGCQVINIYHGGNLYQDLTYREGETFKHWQGHDPEKVTHSILVDEGSKVYQMIGSKEVRVNSFHHQLIKTVPDDFRVSARAKDGVVEAIEARGHRFLVGVQWHPEMLYKKDDGMNVFFRRLIETALEDES
ncbi:gamma-glutamyl-gamma-aminobutyrate hydrolase family protein [Lactococcus termiticola]|uniref:Glutamine amidotransferase n=1 Tax=Lactococcus termiticola TaxID=2169526 RepID=A0A2R5HL47_9LACT|nr:gamma-glutamyl-gamma-aminobutyrate hydrolase family protein [Lactococcus termiticola]GBG97521.1 glutamine amidotransferase [Lactococcus termiticola]